MPTIIAVALGTGFAASVLLNISQDQRARQDRKLLQGEITDLRYQHNQDKIALSGASPTPSPSASPLATPEASSSPTPAPTATPAVLDASPSATIKNCSVANLRADASSNSPALVRSLPKGTAVTLGTDLRNGYRQVTVSGKTGYILASCLE